MAFNSSIQVQGDERIFTISPEIKKYTLLDLGFILKNSGSYNFERSLDPTSPFKQGIKLKVTVNKNLDGLKMATVSANGMQNVNIFKRTEDQPLVEQYNFIVQELVSRNVIKINK